MSKWLLTLAVAVFVIGLLQPRLAAWLRMGRLPGDVRVRLRGREYLFPFASTVIWSLIATAILRLL